MTKRPSARVVLDGGLSLSRIIPGVMRLLEWNLTPNGLNRWIHACLDLGCTTFDHADIYGSYQCEAAFGEAMVQTPGLRDSLQLVTKCGIALVSPNRPAHRVHHYDTSRTHILAAVDRSLENLRTDRIDLLLIHRPNPLLDADEVAAALHELRRSGKVLHFGVSNFLPFQMDLLQARLTFPLVTNQIELSVVHLDPLHDGTLDQAQLRRQPPMIWSPLGGGRVFSAGDERSVRVRKVLNAIADQLGCTPDQVALAWVMRHPAHPLPVLGTGRLVRIVAAVAVEDLALETQQWFAIWEASAGREVP